GSGRDAGATRDNAVQLTRNDMYTAIVGVPTPDGTDAADWYSGFVSGDAQDMEAKVWLPETSKVYIPQPAITLELWGPGDAAPRQTGEQVRVVDPEPGLWSVRIASTFVVDCDDAASLGAMPARDHRSVLGTYEMYFGCNPHCDRAVAN
ncbi:MAG: hypothetical protein ACREI7_11655, partial [Myxococcota bacterium]